MERVTVHFRWVAAVALPLFLVVPGIAGDYVFTVRGEKTYLNGSEMLVKGLLCSNALISDSATQELIDNLDTFAAYGVNTVSVYFMGSRFGDVKGTARMLPLIRYTRNAWGGLSRRRTKMLLD